MHARIMVAGLLAAALLASCGDGSKPSATAGPADTTTADLTPTLPPVTSTASPPPTPTTGPVALQLGMQGALGYDTVLYYSVACFACGRPQVPNLYRVYATPNGSERTDDLFASLAGFGGYAHSFAADWERGELWVAQCTSGYCGGEAAPSADATEALAHSKDGGISWELISSLPPGTDLVGAAGGLLYSSFHDPSAGCVYRVDPSNEVVSPPNADARSLVFVPGLGIAWRAATANGSMSNTLFNLGGDRIFEPKVNTPTPLNIIQRTDQGFLATWSASAPTDKMQDIRVGYFDASGEVTRSWSWTLAMDTGTDGPNGYQWFEVEGQLSENRLYASVLTPQWFEFGTDSPGITQEQLRHGRMFPMEIAFINLDSATVHPVHGPSFNLTLNQNPFVVHVDTGPVARVSTGADCLNVRVEPSATATSLGCFHDGVLLRLREEPDRTISGMTWRAVLTPDGRPGWASADFLER